MKQDTLYEPNHLDTLENQSIYILREAYRKFKKLAMLWSIGKDSTVLLWLARKAFAGNCPIPLVHIDTTKKIPEMIAFRDKVAQEWNVRLIVGKNEQALAEGMGPDKGRITCCQALKTEALQQLMAEHEFTGLILGIRRDEEGTGAKERTTSPRVTRTSSGTTRISRRSFGTSSRPTSTRTRIFAFTRCCTGRRSTFGAISSAKTSQ